MTVQTNAPAAPWRPSVVVCCVAVLLIGNILFLAARRGQAPKPVEGSVPSLSNDPSGKFDEIRMAQMAKVDEAIGIRDAQTFREATDKDVAEYIGAHNANAKKVHTLAFSAGSDWTDFYGGEVLPAKAEFAREGFRFTWKVGPWHRFHWNGRTGWSDADGGGKFSVDNLNFSFLQLLDPGDFELTEKDKEIEVMRDTTDSILRRVDVLKSPDVELMFDTTNRRLARSVFADPTGKRRTYLVDFIGTAVTDGASGIWIPETVAVTFVPRDGTNDRPYRAATYIEKGSIIANGKTLN